MLGVEADIADPASAIIEERQISEIPPISFEIARLPSNISGYSYCSSDRYRALL